MEVSPEIISKIKLHEEDLLELSPEIFVLGLIESGENQTFFVAPVSDITATSVHPASENTYNPSTELYVPSTFGLHKKENFINTHGRLVAKNKLLYVPVDVLFQGRPKDMKLFLDFWETVHPFQNISESAVQPFISMLNNSLEPKSESLSSFLSSHSIETPWQFDDFFARQNEQSEIEQEQLDIYYQTLKGRYVSLIDLHLPKEWVKLRHRPNFTPNVLVVYLTHGTLESPFISPIDYERYINTDFGCDGFNNLQQRQTIVDCLDQRDERKMLSDIVSMTQHLFPNDAQSLCSSCRDPIGQNPECSDCAGYKLYVASNHRSGKKNIKKGQPMFNKYLGGEDNDARLRHIFVRCLDAAPGEPFLFKITIPQKKLIKLSTVVWLLHRHGVKHIVGADFSCSPYKGPSSDFRLYGGVKTKRLSFRSRAQKKRQSKRNRSSKA
jgi:hypothetical protein